MEEERGLINDLKRYGRLAVAWNRHGSPVPRRADAKYRMHTRPYKALHTALFPVVADTVGYLHQDAVRLLYHADTVKASGNVDNEGLIWRAREDHRFGFRSGGRPPPGPRELLRCGWAKR